MATWQEKMGFQDYESGATADLGSHTASGWEAGVETVDDYNYRGVRVEYQFDKPFRIVKIEAKYTYSQGSVNFQKEMNVNANVYNSGTGVDTGLYFGEGERAEITATGEWNPGVGLYGPNGNENAQSSNVVAVGINDFSLIGRFGFAPWEFVGEEATLTAPLSGNLRLMCNDVYTPETPGGDFLDNTEYLTVTIKRLDTPHVFRLFNGSIQVTQKTSVMDNTLQTWIGNIEIDKLSVEAYCSITNGTTNGNVILESITIYGDGVRPVIIKPIIPCINEGSTGDCNSALSHASANGENGGSPISLRDGEKREKVTDLVLNSPVGELSFTRSYRQRQNSALDSLAIGWSHNHAIKLVPPTVGNPNLILIYTGNGGVVHFTYDSVSQLYKGDPGSVAQISVGTEDESKYTVTASDKSLYVFDNNGLIQSRIFPNGDALTYTYYDPIDDQTLVEEVTDGYGRKLKFHYIVNPGNFDHLKLWRVGDQDANLETPAGRYIEFSYLPEKLYGDVDGDGALLHTVRDVRGNVWTYEYYGQQSNEGEENLKNFLVRYRSPLVDMTGDGELDDFIDLKELEYMLDDGDIFFITQRLGGVNGNFLQVREYLFQSDATIETTSSKSITHHFIGGVYKGVEDAAHNTNFQGMNTQYRPSVVQDANLNATHLDWSEDGKHLTRVTDALNHTTDFSYDSQDRLEESRDVNNRRTKYIYNGNSRQPEKILFGEGEDPNFVVLKHQKFVYDEKGRVLEEYLIDPAGGENGVTPLHQITRTYHTSGNGEGLIESITHYERNHLGDFVFHDSTTYTYDSAGRVIKTARSSLFGNCQFTYTAYDPAGNIVATACGRENVNPAPTTQEEIEGLYDADDLEHPERKDTRVTVHSYDTLGRRFKTISNFGMAIEQTTLTVYDELNRVIRTIANYVQHLDGNGNPFITDPFIAAHSDFDDNNQHGDYNNQNLVTDTAYNPWGMVAKQTDLMGNITFYGYDDANRVTRIVQYPSFPDYDYENDPTLQSYLAYEWEQVSEDADKDLITSNTYDRVGNLVMTTDVLGNNHFTVYDALNRPVKTVRNAKTSATIAYEIGDMDYVAEDDPRSDDYLPSEDADKDLITSNTYDRVGNLVMTTDVLGNNHFTVYDALNRPVKTVRNAKPSATIAYEIGDSGYVAGDDPRSASYVISTAPDCDMIETTEYDALGRVIRTARLINNRPTAIWDTTLYGYDGLGRQIKVIRNASDGDYDIATDPDLSGYTPSTDADKDIISTTTYDGDGRVWYPEDVNGNKTYMVYDGLGRQVKRILNYVSQGSSNPADWMWDDADERWEIGTNNPVDFGSFEDENIVSETHYNGDGRVLWTRDMLGRRNYTVYDNAGRVIRQVANYDPTGLTNADPADWVWDAPAGRWEDGANNTVARGSHDDKNIVTDMLYDAQGRVHLTIDTWIATPTSIWYFDSGEFFDDGLNFG